MNAYIGFDISLKATHVCVVDEDGTILKEVVLASDVPAIDRWLKDATNLWTIQRIVFETGQLSTHFHHGLHESWPVVCIDARHAHATLLAQRNKTDKHDARGLAQIARTGWYKPVHVKSDQGQALRAMIGGRKQLVNLRLALENHIRGTLKTFGVKLGLVSAAVFANKVRAALEGKNSLLRDAMLALLNARDGLLAQQQAMHKQCVAIAESDAVCKRLMTVPGVGVVTALTYQAEIEDPHRFKRSRDVGAHIGLTPRRIASGEMDRSGGISRCGNGALRTLLFEASVTMLTRSKRWSRLKVWGLGLLERNGFKSASTAMARKLAVVMHRMWMDGTDFVYGNQPASELAT